MAGKRVAGALPRLYDMGADHGIVSPVALVEYLTANRDQLRRNLADAGAILLRGAGIRDIEDFEAVTAALTSRRARYSGGDAKRTLVSDFVYTANDVAGHRSISPHNELGYSLAHPELLFFYCRVSADHGGATTLVDGRRLLDRLPSDLVGRLRQDEIVYIQNLPAIPDTGVQGAKTWQRTFETEDRAVVETALRQRGAAWRWESNGTLHVEETVPAILRNPRNGDETLFCQADRWHASEASDADRREIEKIPSDQRYHHARFNNLGEFNEHDLSLIRRSKQEFIERFTWFPGDILCIDNTSALHGRDSFVGGRELFVAMGDF